ncbi:DUF1345 domain-containing protein [Undibacterium terreum]|uniref:DUF1345 domain-containing protein n=1 Tax=Undibacterium terreum TaxID=1224302 RepID=A0A916UQ49_9BURK|nr:DUF1345 domain-containing protein [Undibacterium terreum]GGC81606.1 hypothetical protein GCM10011396_31050 [Undibacterium terreum]
MSTLHRIIRTRPRLMSAIAFGIAVTLLIPASVNPVTRALLGWNAIIWPYLCLIGWLMAHASHARIRTIAEKEHRGAAAILAIMSIAAVASLAAIVLELSAIKDLSFSHKLLHYALTASTVFGSWCLVAVLFTFHYALIFYQSKSHQHCLRFPEDEQNPDYWDFLYFSFTIAVAAQTSDITVMSKPMRKTVLAQSVLSFLFNVAILGLTINIAAGLVAS